MSFAWTAFYNFVFVVGGGGRALLSHGHSQLEELSVLYAQLFLCRRPAELR